MNHSLAPGQSHDYPGAKEATLDNKVLIQYKDVLTV